MKILFAGTPAIAVQALEAAAATGFAAGVLTNPDRPAGRKRILEASPVKQKAIELGLEVFQPETLSPDFIQELKDKNYDTLITFAFGKIFRENFLSVFFNGAFNIHPSLLPLHRGASPINSAILSGDTETGITIQKMALAMDSGDIALQCRFPLNGTETAQSLSDYVASKASQMIPEFITMLLENRIEYRKQDGNQATYCKTISKDEGRISWTEDAELIQRKTRGYYPWPGTYTTWGEKTIAITKAELYRGDSFKDKNSRPGTVLGTEKGIGIIIKTGNGLLAVEKLKPQAKNEMDWKSFLNGVKNFIGTELGETL